MQGLQALDGLSDVMVTVTVAGERPKKTSTGQLSVVVSKEYPGDIGRKPINADRSEFRLPSADVVFQGVNMSAGPVAVKVLEIFWSSFLGPMHLTPREA